MSSDVDTILYLLNIGNLLYKTFGLLIVIIGTIGNILNCFVFLCISPLNKHPNALFIIGSSIGSFFFINIGLLSAVIQIYSGINPSNRWLIWCKIYSWLYYSFGCFSYMCNCYTAFGQFLITSPKIKWQRLITRFKAKLMIIFTIIIWFLIFLPLPIYYNHIPITFTCRISNSIINIYTTYWLIIGYYSLPILLILILFCLTWYNLKQLLRRRRSLESAVTRMMLIQMCIILISGIPAFICAIYTIITQYYSKTLLRLVYESIISTFFVLFTFFTNGLSFWVYLFASKTFRKHLKDYISKRKLFRHRITPCSTSITRINVRH